MGVNTTGQSGHPRSPHYFDQNRLWRQGQYRPLPFTRDAVEAATVSQLDSFRTGYRQDSATYVARWTARRRHRMAVEVGSKAPDFTLVDQDREQRDAERGARARATSCWRSFLVRSAAPARKSSAHFRDTMSNFRGVNANVLGISTDTFFALKAWDDQQKLGFPLLSDYNKEVINAYDVVNPDMIGLKNIAKRAVFVIDKGGVVRYREVLEDARNEPDYAKLNEAVWQTWQISTSRAPSARSTPSRSSRSTGWIAAKRSRFSSAG